MTDKELNELFRSLRDNESATVSEALEGKLRLAFRASHRRNRMRRRMFEIAACLALALGLYFLFTEDRNPRAPEAASAGEYRNSGFVLLPYGQNDVPLEDPVIVRLQIGPAELNRLGVPSPALPRGSRVEADLLVGQDGIARAVRVNRSF